MDVELVGFTELDNESSLPSTARNPHTGKQAQEIEKDEIITYELRPHKVLNIICPKFPSPMFTVTARDI